MAGEKRPYTVTTHKLFIMLMKKALYALLILIYVYFGGTMIRWFILDGDHSALVDWGIIATMTAASVMIISYFISHWPKKKT